MENAVKALYIVAGFLLGVMLIGLMVYIFKNGARFGMAYEDKTSQEQLQAFNTQFAIYERNTKQKADGTFLEKGNVVSDVVSAVNLAYNINRKNEFDNVNHVEILIYLNSGTPKYTLLNSEKIQKQQVFKGNVDTAEQYSLNDFMKSEINAGGANYFINDVKYNNATGEMIYRFYFDGKARYNERTGKIDQVEFKLYETKQFDSI